MAVQVRFHRPVEDVGVAKEKVKDGDHVYILRRRWRTKYIYSHHGIVDMENGQVIHFSNTEEKDHGPEDLEPENWGVEKHELTEEARAKGWVKNIAKSRLVNDILNWVLGIDIKAVKLEHFEDASAKKYLVYKYQPSTEDQQGQEWHPEPSKDARNAVLLARWFKDHPEAFGMYHLYKWNCEHFVTFCKTTSLTTVNLERALQEKKLTREFLQQHSNAQSTQAREGKSEK